MSKIVDWLCRYGPIGWVGCLGMTLMGCTSQVADTGDELKPDRVNRTVEDLVRLHQEVFDRLVLYTISEEDCEYPSFDEYGTESWVFTSDAYPFPDFNGTVSMEVEMQPSNGIERWSMSTTYTEVSVGEDLSEGTRPIFDGEGSWWVETPGRNHLLLLSLSVDGERTVPVELSFQIGDYVSGGYYFSVTGSHDGEPIDDAVFGRYLCLWDG